MSALASGRVETVVLNLVVNGLLFYGVGRALRGHRAGVGLGLAAGLLAAGTALSLDGRSGEPSGRPPTAARRPD